MTRRHRRLADVNVRWATARADAVREILAYGCFDEQADLGAFASNAWIEELAAEKVLAPRIERFHAAEATHAPLVAFPRTALWLFV